MPGFGRLIAVSGSVEVCLELGGLKAIGSGLVASREAGIMGHSFRNPWESLIEQGLGGPQVLPTTGSCLLFSISLCRHPAEDAHGD
jgi:hypothetical protein